MLSEAGADPERPDLEGKSAMDLARHFGNREVLAVLEGAQEATELLALRELGIGTHRGERATGSAAQPERRQPAADDASRSPTSVSERLPAGS